MEIITRQSPYCAVSTHFQQFYTLFGQHRYEFSGMLYLKQLLTDYNFKSVYYTLSSFVLLSLLYRFSLIY